MMDKIKAEIFQIQFTDSVYESKPKYPHGVTIHQGEEWRVEAIIEDGAIETTTFANHKSRERAIAYAENRYGDVQIKEIEKVS